MTLNGLKRPIPVAALLAIVAQGLFLFRVYIPHKLVFDEVHYVPAARTLLALSGPANIEHPLLGKGLIAIGIALFGDNALGWRAMSTLAGTATVVAIYALTLAITQRVRPSVVAAVLALLNFTLFVQARIAMLDGFMAAFALGGLALLALAMRRGRWRLWIAGAASMGLAVACKWSAAPFVAVVAVGFVWAKREEPSRWPGLAMIPAVLVLGIVSIGVYFLTFAPTFYYRSEPMTLVGLLPFQLEMYARQAQVLPAHTYQSRWWTWPIPLRPIWYLYEFTDAAQRGILLVGNPAIMWAGFVAVAASFGGWIKTGSPRLLSVAMLWLSSYLVWAVIPKSLGFYYYYYLPSLILPIVIAVALDHWRARAPDWDLVLIGLSAVLFGYFLPILSAWALSSPGAFHRWTWFSTWV